MDEAENRAAVERFWSALERQDFDAAVAELDDDFQEWYPQSGERIVGRENFLGVLRSFPGFPQVNIVRHRGKDGLWVTEASFDYMRDGSPLWRVCEVQEVGDGKIRRITAYFGAPFEAADWRKPFVEIE